MALPRRKFETSFTPAERPDLRVAGAGAMFAPSPARELQQLLAERAAESLEPEIERWSRRRRVAIIVSAAASLWLLIFAGGASVVQLVA